MESLYFSPMLLGLNLMLASAIACSGLWYFSRPYRGPGLWMLGSWTLIIGILLFMGFMASGSKLLNILGNALQLAGEAIILLGVFRFLGLPLPWWTVPASAGLMSLALSWHWWLSPINSEYLVALYAAIGGLLPLQACWALWRTPSEAELRGVCQFVAIALLGYALVTLMRGVIGIHDGLQGIVHDDVTRSVSYLLPYNFGIPLWLVALVGLVLLTMRRILADSQRNAQQAAANAERFERLMSVSNAGVMVLDGEHIIDSNPKLEQLFAQTREQLLGQPLSQLFDSSSQQPLSELLQQADGRPHDLLAQRADGQPFAAELSIARLAEAQQQVAEIRDVSQRKALEEQLRQLATTDPLTSALNRRAFQQRAEHELVRSQRQGTPLCLAMLDLDHFKRVNDQYGHAVGDKVLVAFSELCRQQARSTDLFARFGGEEFVILLPDSDLNAAQLRLERLRNALHAQPLDTAQGPLHVTVSIGLSCAQPGDSLQQLLQRADAQLYNAKAQGRNRIATGE